MNDPAAAAPRICDDACCGGASSADLLRELGRFAGSWRWGRLIEPLPAGGPRLTRSEVDRRIAERARADGELLEDLRRYPRWAYMVALNDAYGTPKLAFLARIREVRLLEETAELRYLALPYDAALQLALEGGGGEGDVAQDHGDRAPAPGDGEPREAFERWLLARAAREPALRDALLFQPEETYRREALGHGSGEPPAFLAGVREIRVIPETASSLALVLRWAPGSAAR